MNDENKMPRADGETPLTQAMAAVDRSDRPAPAAVPLNKLRDDIQRVASHAEKAAPPAQIGQQRVSATKVLHQAVDALLASHARFMAMTASITGQEMIDPVVSMSHDGDPISTQIKELSQVVAEVSHEIDAAITQIRGAL